MQRVWTGLEQVPAGFGPSAVTIGNFDGVHLGHRSILRAVAADGRARSLASVAVTFDPHPLAVVAPESAPPSLTSVRQKAGLIHQHGVDCVAVLPFTRELSLLSPRDFAGRVLERALGARSVLVGANFRFGRDQAGNAGTLRRLGEEMGFEVSLAETVLVGSEPVSSTRVRNLVRQGRVEEVQPLLGREFSMAGPIVAGEGIGSKRTVPTLNLAPESGVLPADGVYITRTRPAEEGAARESITNVGLRPTFDGQQRTVETFLLHGMEGPDPDAIELEFLRRIREERKFPTAQSLREQIAADIQVAERFFRELRTS